MVRGGYFLFDSFHVRGMSVAEHYFSREPKVISNPWLMDVQVRGVTLRLNTDAGVFSKGELDKGTRILIEQVTLREHAKVADLGCGYGVVTAALGTVYPDSTWVMMDVNERAVNLAAENTKPLGSRVRVVLSDGFAAFPDEKCTDVILNPPIRAGKEIVYRLYREARDHLVPGGSLWIVIQKKHGAPSTQAFLQKVFNEVEVCFKKAGYYVYRCF
jgi:16S rRNA (guanine1207-N2)-methyltransferase